MIIGNNQIAAVGAPDGDDLPIDLDFLPRGFDAIALIAVAPRGIFYQVKFDGGHIVKWADEDPWFSDEVVEDDQVGDL